MSTPQPPGAPAPATEATADPTSTPPAPTPTQGPGPAPGAAETRRMAEQLLTTVREDIGRADTKAAILLSGALAFLAVVFSRDQGPLPTGGGLAVLVVAGVLWTAGVVMLVSVVLPRTRPGAERTLLRELVSGTSAASLRARLESSGADATGWLLEQASVHGVVLAAKYRWLRLGVAALALGALLALFSELW
ncbi:Pycsar system effector family protein [Streptomyces sp. NPDC053431]|uniref:Pycsar system effector family protein n=1 Tax=Streptomyces sp. NPDC053431 TaxID=3365703 RepID=UPI0037D04545